MAGFFCEKCGGIKIKDRCFKCRPCKVCDEAKDLQKKSTNTEDNIWYEGTCPKCGRARKVL